MQAGDLEENLDHKVPPISQHNAWEIRLDLESWVIGGMEKHVVRGEESLGQGIQRFYTQAFWMTFEGMRCSPPEIQSVSSPRPEGRRGSLSLKEFSSVKWGLESRDVTIFLILGNCHLTQKGFRVLL